jgi:hypothetical protein
MLMRNNSGPGRRDVPLRVRIFPHTAARPLPGLRRRDRQGRRRHRDASLHADPELLLRHVQGPAGGVFDRRRLRHGGRPDLVVPDPGQGARFGVGRLAVPRIPRGEWLRHELLWRESGRAGQVDCL